MSEFQTSHLFATVCPRLPEDREGRGSVRSASKTDRQENTHSMTSATSVNTNTDLTFVSNTECVVFENFLRHNTFKILNLKRHSFKKLYVCIEKNNMFI